MVDITDIVFILTNFPFHLFNSIQFSMSTHENLRIVHFLLFVRNPNWPSRRHGPLGRSGDLKSARHRNGISYMGKSVMVSAREKVSKPNQSAGIKPTVDLRVSALPLVSQVEATMLRLVYYILYASHILF